MPVAIPTLRAIHAFFKAQNRDFMVSFARIMERGASYSENVTHIAVSRLIDTAKCRQNVITPTPMGFGTESGSDTGARYYQHILVTRGANLPIHDFIFRKSFFIC